MATSAKKKKIQQMEMQDSLGISRIKHKHTFPPNLFLFIKFVLVVLIPVFYFVYSPALLLLMVLYTFLFYLARLSERSLNKSVVKKNHIKIPKFDSAISLILAVIAIFGTLLATTNKNKSSTFENFDKTKIEQFIGNSETKDNSKFNNENFQQMKKQANWATIKTKFINMGTLLTGERNIFKSSDSTNKFNIGTVKPPEDFVTKPENIPENMKTFDEDSFELPENGEMNFNRGGMFKNDIDFSMDNIPLEYTFSSTLSSIITVLIFSVSFFGLISILQILLKISRFNRAMNEVIFEEKITLLDDEELERILSFGEDVEYKKENTREINKKIKEEHKQTLLKALESTSEKDDNESSDDYYGF